jgi:hypothetical protein
VLAIMSIEPVAERLEKLLKMLSSPREGEVVAAAQAIMRTLKSAGADIHDLAACVKGVKLSDAEMKKIYDAGYRDAKQEAKSNGGDFHDVGPSWHDMAVECRDRDNGRLTPREREFVEDMVRWTARREPSEKQGKWLHVLYMRVCRRQ